MSKKVKTYKTILDFLDHADPDVLELLKITCAEYSFATKGKLGITFLIPKDPEYRQRIADLAYSSNPDDVNKACDMLNALIIQDRLKTTSDWMDHRDDIPNSLRQVIEVEGVQGKDIKLKNGSRVTPDTRFNDGSKKQNLAVWILTGEIPIDGKAAQFKYAKDRKKGVAQTTAASDYSRGLRQQIAIEVENAYMFDRIGSTLKMSKRTRDVYLEYTLSLVNFVVNVKQDMGLFYGRMLPLISYQKIDFYNFVEPYRKSGEYLVPDYIIQEWYTSKQQCGTKQVIEQINNLLQTASKFEPVKIYTDRLACLAAIDQIRVKIMQGSQTRPREIADNIFKIYDDLSTNNRLDGLTNVYPTELSRWYASEPGLKIMQDELRFLTFSMFDILESNGRFERSRFEYIVAMIGEYMNCQTQEERERVLKLLNKNTIKYLISPIEKVNEIRIFVNSTHFIYIPLTQSEIEKFPQKHVVTRPDPGNLSIYNIEKATMIKCKRLDNTRGSDLADLLELAETDPKKIDPGVLATIKAIAARATEQPNAT